MVVVVVGPEEGTPEAEAEAEAEGLRFPPGMELGGVGRGWLWIISMAG